jgi:hypothetical protein
MRGMAGGHLEDRRQALHVAGGSWRVLDPALHPLTTPHVRPGSRHRTTQAACFELATDHVVWQSDGQRLASDTGEHPPARIRGGPAEHPAAAHAAVLFDEVGEKG